MDLVALRENILQIYAEDGIREVPKDEYSAAKYPKLLPVMSFVNDRYLLPGFGHMMIMHTTSKIGMELLTVAMMPFAGGNVPFMLADIVKNKEKRNVLVEYYDCTKARNEQPLLKETAAKYAGLADYHEKPAWYVAERAPYSLIKEGTEKDDEQLCECILENFRAYRSSALAAAADEANLEGLKVFRERMIHEGNPATEILNKVLGKEGAVTFFKKCVMPVNDKGE